jgi:hypothetical protein
MSLSTNIIEKIASYIPGYAGYKQKELRRESDALVRRHVSSVLSSAKAKMVLTPTAARAVAANPDARYLWDSAKALFDRVIQRIDKAPEGYSGFYDLVKVDEAALDEIYRMDLALVEKAGEVAKLVDEISAAQPGSDVWIQKLQALSSALSQLDSAIDERNNFIAGYTRQQAEEAGRQIGAIQAAEQGREGGRGFLKRLFGGR